MERFLEFDHSVLAVNDLILAERFYSEVLGEILGEGYIEDRAMLTTDEVLRGKALRERMEQRQGSGYVMAPHSTVKVGIAVLPLFLHQDHAQEPPPEQMKGTPRLAFTVTPEQIEKAMEVLRRRKVAFEGPVEHAPPCPTARSLYFKDPSSNFLELSCPREG